MTAQIPQEWTMEKEKKYSDEISAITDDEEFNKKWRIIETLTEEEFYEFLSSILTDAPIDSDDPGRYWLDAISVPDLKVQVATIKTMNSGQELACKCQRPKTYMCAPCGVTRDGIGEPWRPLYSPSDVMDNSPTLPARKSTETKAYNSGSWDGGSDWASSSSYKWDEDWFAYGCRHYGAVVYMQDVEFFASSVKNKRLTGDFVPDFGLYCDYIWEPFWRNEHILWPDHQEPDYPEIAFEQILSAVEMALDGLSVEFGCIGGHGRTGTALAVAGVILGMGAEEAIDYVRDAYCKDAIESAKQEWYVYWCHAQLHGLPSPEKPKNNFGGYNPNNPAQNKTTYTPLNGTKSVCIRSDHYNAWKDGKDKCPKFGDNCDWWKSDFDRFQQGWRPGDGYDPQTIAVRGYMVPKPRPGEASHSSLAKRGCKCDACRYLDRGFRAFMQPSIAYQKEFTRWTNDMAWLDAIQNAIDDPPAKSIKVAQKSGEIIEFNVSDKWKDLPPTRKGVNGDIRGEFMYIEGEGWVWQKLVRSQMKEAFEAAEAAIGQESKKVNPKKIAKQKRQEAKKLALMESL